MKGVDVSYCGTLGKAALELQVGTRKVLLALHRQEAWEQPLPPRGCYKGLEKHKNENHRVVLRGGITEVMGLMSLLTTKAELGRQMLFL